MSAAVEARGVVAGFGSQTVLHGVDLSVPAGSVTGVFGLNGAGKSVLLKTIAGVVPLRSGTVTLGDVDVSKWSPERRVGAGMAHVPQGRQVFRSLSVEANLRVGGFTLSRSARRSMSERLEQAYATFPLLADRRRQPAGTLSGGQQAALAVARALISSPSLVLIDEPSAGLAPSIVDELLETLVEVRRTGVTMLLVEQNIRFGLRLADRAVLLQRGRVVYEGASGELDESELASRLGVGRLLGKDLKAGLQRGPRRH
ncbi:MAG TPA: ABC transporter ATP-binding protein [Mycobacteriales bacterium]|nr:ABC transporter ATP-binding protein [Mycobacteriales bacterium]